MQGLLLEIAERRSSLWRSVFAAVQSSNTAVGVEGIAVALPAPLLLMAERLEGGVSRLAYGTDQGRFLAQEAVSYTHLTLPTIYSV